MARQGSSRHCAVGTDRDRRTLDARPVMAVHRPPGTAGTGRAGSTRQRPRGADDGGCYRLRQTHHVLLRGPRGAGAAGVQTTGAAHPAGSGRWHARFHRRRPPHGARPRRGRRRRPRGTGAGRCQPGGDVGAGRCVGEHEGVLHREHRGSERRRARGAAVPRRAARPGAVLPRDREQPPGDPDGFRRDGARLLESPGSRRPARSPGDHRGVHRGMANGRSAGQGRGAVRPERAEGPAGHRASQTARPAAAVTTTRVARPAEPEGARTAGAMP